LSGPAELTTVGDLLRRDNAADALLQLAHHQAGALDRRADSHLEVEIDDALVGLRHQLDVDGRRKAVGPRQQDAGRGDGEPAIGHHVAQQPQIARLERGEPALQGARRAGEQTPGRPAIGQGQQARRQRRHQRDRHDQRRDLREDDD
jgi:hypothetical protein